MGKEMLLFLLILILILTLSSGQSYHILGLDTYLSKQLHTDPQASNDTFLNLPSFLKKSLSVSLSKQISLSLSLSVPIHIKLIGNFQSTSPTTLQTLISSLPSPNPFNVIQNLNHILSIHHSPALHVSLPIHLTQPLSDSIRSHLDLVPRSLRSDLRPIPYSAVDLLIRSDFHRDKSVDGVHIYIMNLGIQMGPYAYSYGSHGESSPGFTKCLGSVWTGTERYLWVDLGAGPVDYGPIVSGDGVLPRGEFHPFSALHGGPKSSDTILADLASIIHSAYQILLVPSLRIPVPFENVLVVQFIHVHGSDSKDSIGLDLDVIKKTLTDDGGLLLGDQSLSFKSYNVSFDDCSICSFAISQSTNSITSRFLFDNYTLISSEYLDSKRLRQILSDSAGEFRKAIGFPENDFSRVLPVYVFDLDYNSLFLLDRYHQSVAFKDMVIAVRTKNTQTVSDYSCNGRHVFTQTRDLDRSIVGSVLQSMWGVAPTHLLWSPSHNRTLVDYTWSIGQTPFGPFSDISSLSFVQKDAARRNVILTLLNYTITSAIDVLDSISAHGGDRYLLRQNRYVEFLQRWNLLKYKLNKCVSALSHLDFETALYYLKSSDHDLYAIHSLAYHASQELEASLVCFKDPPVPWASVSMSAVGLFALFYAYVKREKLFKNKRKQF